MPFETPTLPQLIQRADADLTANAADAMRRSDQAVLGRVHAGATFGLHGHIKWAADQILPDTCDESMLLRVAKFRLTTPRGEAIAATGWISMKGQPTAVIDGGSILQTKDGRRYATVGTVEFSGAQAQVRVTAIEPGKLGDVPAGEVLELVSPVLGVEAEAVVSGAGIVGGTDQESIEALRARVIRSFRRVPHGGSADDYVEWATDVNGITRAWCLRNYMGPGTVGLFVARDGDENPIPPQPVLDRVKEEIEAARPVTAELYVLAPVEHPIAYRIRLMPDSTQIRAAVEKNLRDLLRRQGDLGVTVLRTHLAEAISQSPGENDHELVQPAGNVALAVNEIPTFGGIEWL
ncbi:baseplate J/gp47 family protein [Ralstonia pseudosolanacearum]|uniref:baseplate J/gp47 family protein n=1 Tax=Ralstonia pseudosolanacearum TaxID=1310165 RepID=UPI003CEA8EAA